MINLVKCKHLYQVKNLTHSIIRNITTTMLSSLLAQSWMQIAKCSSNEASFFFLVQRENDKNTWNVYFYLNLAGISFASTLITSTNFFYLHQCFTSVLIKFSYSSLQYGEAIWSEPIRHLHLPRGPMLSIRETVHSHLQKILLVLDS